MTSMSKNRTMFLVLASSLATGAALAQDAPLTGTLKVGEVSLLRTSGKFPAGPLGNLDSTTDSFSAAFSVTDLSKVVRTEPRPFTTIGPRFVFPIVPTDPPATGNNAVTYLDAGPALNLAGPNGMKSIPVAKLLYGAQLGGGLAFPGLPSPAPLFLVPGTYTVDNGGGGADVGPFTATLTLPEPFVWTNADTVLPITRDAGADITWTGGDPDTKVSIAGGVTVINSATRRVEGGAIFSCLETNSAGHFVIPPEVLTLIPASTTTAGVPNGSLIVTNGVQAKMDLPGFDQSLFVFTSGIVRSAEYK